MKFTLKFVLFATFIALISSLDSSSSTHNIIMDQFLNNEPSEVFRVWHHIYDKENEYKAGSEEYRVRFSTFLKELKLVKAHNADSTKTWKTTMTQFADRSVEELKAMFPFNMNSDRSKLIGKVKQQNLVALNKFYILDVGVPTKVEFNPIDWSYIAGSVDYQGNCGCCYAFSGVNAIEANYAISNGLKTPVKLSRQNIVDCNPLTNGCNGGDPLLAVLYAHSVGLMLDADYPFANKVNTCSVNNANAKVYVKGAETTINYTNKNIYNSDSLYTMLQSGPVAVGIDANVIMSYKSGILDLTNCVAANHSVLLVGYGIDLNRIRYWLIKNSWATTWGEKGYIRVVVKDTDGISNCFLGQHAVRPIA